MSGVRFCLRANTRQGEIVDMSVSAPTASGGIDAEGAKRSADVDQLSTSVSLDPPGERLLQQIGFSFRPVCLPCDFVVFHCMPAV